MLGAVPGWVNVGELVDLPRSVYPSDERCGCGEAFSACPFWLEVGRQAFGGWEAGTLGRLAALRHQVARQRRVPALVATRAGRGQSALRTLVTEYQAQYGRIYQAVAEVSGAAVVVDASKGPAHGLALGVPLASDPGYDLTMVNLVRDPRGVAFSWSRRQHQRPQAGAGNARMWSIGVGRSAGQWAALQTEMDVIGRATRIRVVRVRYEDLVATPRTAMASLLGALGRPATEADLAHVGRHAVTLQSSHGLSGNPGRFRHGTLDLVADDQWRRDMPRSEQRLVTAATLPWLAGYGYRRARPAHDSTNPPTTARKSA